MLRSTHPTVATLAVAALLVLGASFGCGETRRVISVRGGLQNIEGAEGGIKPASGRSGGVDLQSLSTHLYGPLPGEPVDGMVLRRKLENGDIKLVSRTPSELIFHLRRTLRDEEWDLLYEHLLSQQLKEAYSEQNLDPKESVEFLKRHSRSIVQMLAMVPGGDRTPGASFQRTGRNTYRLTVPGGRSNEVPFASMDIVYEQREFRLRMFN